MLNARPVKTIVSFLLIFALSLFASGCGSANEEKVIGESAAQAAVSAEETADKTDEEIPDKFVMLKEVYDILSSPLGEPYRTPEYWGGEEIDMMKVGDNYLIGLRNIQNQMHYLLYDKNHEILELLETQNKRIAWQDIRFHPGNKQLDFPYCETNPSDSAYINSGTITYDLSHRTYSQKSDSVPSSALFWKFDNKIPVAQVYKSSETDFSCLFSAYNILSQTQFPSTSKNKMTEMRDLFNGESIVILNQIDYLLIGLKQDIWSINYYLYEKKDNNLIPMEIYSIMSDFEKIRFQPQESMIAFPYSGKKILDICDFPTTVIYNRETGCYTEYLQPLLSNHPLYFQVGASTPNPWQIYRILINQNSPQMDVLCIYYEMPEMVHDCDPPYCPRIFFESKPDRSVSVLIESAQISQELKQKLLNFDSVRIQNINMQEAVKEVVLYNGIISSVNGLEISFTVPDDYFLFGEVARNQNKYDTGSYLKLYFSDNKTAFQDYILEYEYLGWY